DASFIENIDDWALHLDGWRWERLTERRWARFELRRQDGVRNHLFELRSALWKRQWHARFPASEHLQQGDVAFTDPRLDLLPSLYRPDVAHEAVPEKEDDEYNVYRVLVNGVVVRYVEETYAVQFTVEGELDA